MASTGADMLYTLGLDIDASGVDQFIAKLRGLAGSVNFGSTGFTPPPGVVSGPGVQPGGAIAFQTPAQGVGFAQAMQAQALGALVTARGQGTITSREFGTAKAQVEGITNALLAGARRFESILGTTAAQTKSGLIVPQSEIDRQEADAARQASVVVAQGIKGLDAATANEARLAAKQEETAIKEALDLRERELKQLRTRLAITGQSTELDRSIARAKAEVLVAEQRQARLEREQNRQVFAEARAGGFFNVGTPMQRIQAATKSRNGQLVDPLGEKTGGQLFATRAVQAGSFALGGLAFYGALQVIRDTLQETERLEREFFVVQGQIERTFGIQGSEVMERFKEQVRDISLQTGALGSEVAFVTRQLAAAFVPQDGTPLEKQRGFELAGRNAEAAFKFSEVTGLDSKEITDSLTALGLSFDELDGNFLPILDSTIALEERFGVLGGNIITFAADLAPLAANLGFTAQSLTELGAVAQKYSGRSGGQLGEQFGRILTDLPTKSADLIGIFSQTPELADLSSGLADAFVAENMKQVLQFILTASERVNRLELDPGLIQDISEKVAGRREGASFAAILKEPRDLLQALQEESVEGTGALEERFQRVRDSLSETMERMRRSVEQLAEAILSAGLADAFKLLATALGAMASGAAVIIRFFDRLNDATHGVAGQVLGLIAIVKTLDAALRAAAASGILSALLGPAAGGALGTAASKGIIPLIRGLGSSALGAAGGAFTAARVAGAGGLVRGAGGLLSSAAEGLGARAAGYAAGGSLLRFGGRLAPLGQIAGVAAPVGAAIAVHDLINEIGTVKESVGAMGNALRIQASQASLGQLISGMQVGDIDTRFRLGVPGTDIGYSVPGTQAFGRIAGVTPGMNKDILREEAVQRFGADGLGAALGAINPLEDLTDSGQEDYTKAYIEIEKAMRGEEADLEFVFDLISDIGGEKPALAAAMDEAAAKAVEIRDAIAEVEQGTSGPQLQALITALTQNRATPEDVKRALEVALEPLRTIAQAAIDAGDYTAYLTAMEQQAQLKTAAERAISESAANAIGMGERFRGLFDDSSPQTRILTATRTLQDPNVTDQEVRFQALEQLTQARNDAFQERLDLAKNEEERLRILDEGPGVDPVAQAEAIYLQVQDGIERKLAELNSKDAKAASASQMDEMGRLLHVTRYTDEIERLEGVTRENIVAISDQLIKDIAAYGSGAVRIRLELLKRRRAELVALLLQTSGPGTESAAAALTSELESVSGQIGTYEAIDESGLDPSQIVVDDGSAPGGAADEAERERKRRELARDRRLAQIAVARAAAAGDPVREAQLAKDAAAVSREFAINEYGAGSIEALNAQAEYINAQNQQNDAFRDIAAAQLELAAARVSRNPLASAQIAIQQADLAVRNAKGTAERLRAEAQRIAAGEQLGDVIRDIAESQYELLIAIAESSGDAVAASKISVDQAIHNLGLARNDGDIAEINRREGELIQAQRSAYDTQLDKQQGDIDFALQMDRITTQQAIASYRMLLEIPTNTEAQNRELQLIIKGLQDELGQDYQFNLPSNLNLPTLYEARRLDQAGAGGYQDNRQININFTANNTADAQAIANTIVDQFSRPSRHGTAGRMF